DSPMSERTFRSKCLSYESSAPSMKGPKTTEPALLTRMSSLLPNAPPKALSIDAISLLVASTVLRSAPTDSALPPASRISLMTFSARSGLAAQFTIPDAPSLAKLPATAAPILRDEPLTSASLYSNGLDIFISCADQNGCRVPRHKSSTLDKSDYLLSAANAGSTGTGEMCSR